MRHTLFDLLHLDQQPHWPSKHTANLTILAEQWVQQGLFWTAESCINTLDHIINLNNYRNHTANFFSAALLIKENSKWVGWYLATIADSQCDLLFVFISDSLRGQGAGAILLGDLIHKCKANHHLKSIFLEVRPSNTPAIALYKKFGFNLQSRRPRYYQNGEDALVYRLEFKKSEN